MINGAEIEQWLAEMAWLWALGSVAILALLCWLVGRWRTVGRCRAMLAAFDDSTRGRLQVLRSPSAGGFGAEFQPAPDPFGAMEIAYDTRSRLDPWAWLVRDPRLRRDRLVIRASMSATPRQELHWVRGEIPGRARGRQPHAVLWLVQRVDFVQSEFATRGLNPSAITHVFTELLTRFEPFLDRVMVLQEARPHVEVALCGRVLFRDEIPPLVALVRALGRAALVE